MEQAEAAGCETGASGSWPSRGGGRKSPRSWRHPLPSQSKGDLPNTNWEWERQVGGQSQDCLFTPPRGYMSEACMHTCSALAQSQP